MDLRSVAVTGVGVICAGANDAEQFWANVQAGHCAVAEVAGIDIGASDCHIGGQVAAPADGTDGDGEFRVTRLLRAALGDVTANAGFGQDLSGADRTRVGISIGYCQYPTAERATSQLMCANGAQLASDLGVTGPRITLSTACSSGSAAIALAAERIAANEADVMFAGGADELLAMSWLGFSFLHALAKDGCAAYSRSSGLVLGEGAALLALEAAEHAAARGVVPLAEIVGWGSSADAYHITAPDPSARGAVLAMRRALDRAGLTSDDVGYVCGHGTGTEANDRMEIKAHRMIFGERAPKVPLSSIKPMIGHTLGAAGAIEAAASVLALRDQILPPTVNFGVGRDPDLDFVPNVARQAPLGVVMSNSYAFGGDNMSLIFARPENRPRRRIPVGRQVCITGVGAVGPVGLGYSEWRDALLGGRSGLRPIQGFDTTDLGVSTGGELPQLSPRGITSAATWRQLDTLSRLALSVVRQAWNDAGLRLTADERNRTGLVFATAAGPMSAVLRFTDSITYENPNPAVFPNIVLTSAPGHVCNALALRGPRVTFASGGVAAVHALEYASALVARGEVDHAVVVAADEITRLHFTTPVTELNYFAPGRSLPLDKASAGLNLGAAGVAFVLEPVGQARARGGHSYGRILGCAVGADAVGGIEQAIAMDPRGSHWEGVLDGALSRAGVRPEQVGYVAATANGVVRLDSLETRVLSGVFGSHVPVSAPKAAVGETMGASAAVGVLACLAALERGVAPRTAGLTDPVGSHRVRHVMDGSVSVTADAVMANAYSVDGSFGAVVIGR